MQPWLERRTGLGFCALICSSKNLALADMVLFPVRVVFSFLRVCVNFVYFVFILIYFFS
jgi:hypothetical protein